MISRRFSGVSCSEGFYKDRIVTKFNDQSKFQHLLKCYCPNWLLHDGGPYHIENSPLIYFTLVSIMIGTSIMNELNSPNVYPLKKGCKFDACKQREKLTAVLVNAVSIAYDLSSGDGKKIVYLQFFQRCNKFLFLFLCLYFFFLIAL